MKEYSIQKERKSYSHLSIYEREKIKELLVLFKKYDEIAKSISRSVSTVSREVKRNSNRGSRKQYSPTLAQKKSDERIKVCNSRGRLNNPVLIEYVVKHLKLGWSPEIIAGRVKMDLGIKTNYESIYLWIYSEARYLIKYLPRRHKKRLDRGSKVKRRTHIPNRVDISERDKDIEKRLEVGHYEVDTVVGLMGNSALAIIVERKTRFLFIRKLEKSNSKNMSEAIILSLRRFDSKLVKTLTYDNGSENTLHEKTNEVLNTRSYFCRPYHSWEKGTVENTAGLIRRYLPKKTNFDLITTDLLYTIQYQLNNRPRKCLQFQTPTEVFIFEEYFALLN